MIWWLWEAGKNDNMAIVARQNSAKITINLFTFFKISANSKCVQKNCFYEQ